MKALSIIIPLYNVEKYINQCISSLYQQSLDSSSFEILVINDGSTDSSAKLAQEFVEKYDNISLHNFENAGLSEARNRGINLATGTYIYFMDSDDYLAHNTLNECLKLAIQNDLDILEFQWHRTRERDLTISTTPTDKITITVKSGVEYFETERFHDSVCTSLYKHSLLKQEHVVFAKGKVMEDMLFNIQIIPKATKVGKTNIDSYRYIINPGSVWNTREASKYRKSIYDFDYMVKATNKEILKNEALGINTQKLKEKQQLMLYNLYKRILQSDLKRREIKEINHGLKDLGLYPLNHYKGNDTIRTILISIFNTPFVLNLGKLGFQLFKKPIIAYINKKHQ